MKKNIFRGFGIAEITPFQENGEVDYEALTALTQSFMDCVDFICVLGTTAETPCLTANEKQKIIDTIQAVNQGRVPLLLGAGGNNTREVCYNVRNCPKGIDGVLIVSPYYNKPTQEGLYQHFKAVAESTPLPVVLYNVPGRTGVNLTSSTTLRLANDVENIVAIKEASGMIDQIEEIIDNAPSGFEVISGDDGITFELLTLGAVGVISVLGNAYPSEFGEMVHSVLNKDYATALSRQRQFRPLYKMLFTDGNPAGIKALLNIQGKAENVLRLPLVPATEKTVSALRDFDAQMN